MGTTVKAPEPSRLQARVARASRLQAKVARASRLRTLFVVQASACLAARASRLQAKVARRPACKQK